MPIGVASHGAPPIGANRPSPAVMLTVAASADAGATTSKLMSAEHVYIESDVSEIPDPRKVRNVQASLRLLSRWRGCITTLDIFEKRFLAVCSKRPRATLRHYAIDLRFVDPTPERRRHVPWKCLQTAAGLMLLSVGLWWWMKRSSLPFSENPWWPALALIVSATVCTALLSTYRMTETLTFFSVHGRVRLFDVVGGLGVFHAARAFEAELRSYVQRASGIRGATRAQQLRDEMREHYRLQQHGVLSMPEYEQSKARILQQHA